MQQHHNLSRLLRALSRKGLNVSYQDGVYSVRLDNSPESPKAEVLLPQDFAVESKALKQLANLATISHPLGGEVTRVCATPDFHPGDAGVAIGSSAQTQNMVIPAAVGSDINCGMRLQVADLSLDKFLSQRNKFVELMKGDYFLGTRDVSMDAKTARGIFQHGIMGWLEGITSNPLGSVAQSDFEQLWQECDRVLIVILILSLTI